MTLKHRTWNRFRATIGGYFWLPCPICGQMFGGHEEHGNLAISYSSGKLTCIECASEAERQSNKLYEEVQYTYYMDSNGCLKPMR